MAQGNGTEALSFDINLTAAQGAPDYCGVFWNNVSLIVFFCVFQEKRMFLMCLHFFFDVLHNYYNICDPISMIFL